MMDGLKRNYTVIVQADGSGSEPVSAKDLGLLSVKPKEPKD